MIEKSHNLRDALELVRMLEQLFASVSRTNEYIPWRGIELTLRQIALSIVSAAEEKIERPLSCATSTQLKGSFSAQGYSKKQPDSLASQIQVQTVAQPIAEEASDDDTSQSKFRSRATVVDRVQTSPVGGYKSKSFAQE